MTDQTTHLTEEERHAAAEGTLSLEPLAAVDTHLATCESCAGDVSRIATFMKRTRESAAPVADEPLDDLWPTIRARIDATKVVSLAHAPASPPKRRRAWLLVAGLAAAVVLAVVAVRARPGRVDDLPIAEAVTDSTMLSAVADSAKAYEAEAQVLLDRLEIQRATMRPETVEAIERNLHTVDVAIAELKDAIARDPNNPALRQLLAASYRQKVELLKRVGNAS